MADKKAVLNYKPFIDIIEKANDCDVAYDEVAKLQSIPKEIAMAFYKTFGEGGEVSQRTAFEKMYKEMKKPKIHTTVGVYPNGEYKCNGVKEENLKTHIEYNKTFRFGRALVVDGEVVYRGFGCDKAIEDLQETIKILKMKTDTAPYR